MTADSVNAFAPRPQEPVIEPELPLPRQSFIGEFAYTAIITVLPVLMFAVAVFFVYGYQQRALVLSGLQSRAASAAQQLDQFFDKHSSVLMTLANSEQLGEARLEGFYEEARRALEREPSWTTVILYDPSGQQLMNMLRPLGSELPTFADLQSSDSVALKKPVMVGRPTSLGPVTRNPLFGIRAPIFRNGDLKYFLTIGLKPEAIVAVLDDLQLPPGWIGAFVDPKGINVACVRCPSEAIGQPISDPVMENVKNDDPSARETITLSGIPSYFSASRASLTGWAAVVRVPREDIWVLWTKGLWLLGLGGLASIVAAFAAMAWLTRRRQSTQNLLEARVRQRTIALQQTLSEKNLLLSEVHHRVYNNLQIVDGLVRFTSQLPHGALHEGLSDLRQRVRALAKVHRRLINSSSLVAFDMAPFLKDLCEELAAGTDPRPHSLSIQTELSSFSANIDFALPVGMLLTELLTQMIKSGHDLPGIRRIRVRFSQEGDHVGLRISDNVSGQELMAALRNPDSLPRRIVHALVGQLSATFIVKEGDITALIPKRLAFAEPVRPPLAGGR